MKTKRSAKVEAAKREWVHIHPQLRDHTGYCFVKLAHRFRSQFEAELGGLDVMAPQCGILTILKEVGPMTQVQLGASVAIDKATMVRLIDGLEEKGYLTRQSHHEDRRAKVLVITRPGEKALEKINQARRRTEKDFFRNLSEAERLQLKNILAKLV